MHWSKKLRFFLPFPSPGDLPDSRIKPGSLALQADFLSSEPPGKPPILDYWLEKFILKTWKYLFLCRHQLLYWIWLVRNLSSFCMAKIQMPYQVLTQTYSFYIIEWLLQSHKLEGNQGWTCNKCIMLKKVVTLRLFFNISRVSSSLVLFWQPCLITFLLKR